MQIFIAQLRISGDLRVSGNIFRGGESFDLRKCRRSEVELTAGCTAADLHQYLACLYCLIQRDRIRLDHICGIFAHVLNDGLRAIFCFQDHPVLEAQACLFKMHDNLFDAFFPAKVGLESCREDI